MVKSNNLNKHIQRKHSAQPPRYAVTADHHLPSQCVDRNNGVYVVARSFMGPCVPVHTARNTSVRVGCDVERCSGRVDDHEYLKGKPRVGVAEWCVHVKSLDYCTSEAQHVEPCGKALSRMVEQRWFGVVTGNQCLKRQVQAEREGVPLVSRVSLGGPEHKHYVSVYEPMPGRYSRTGRVLVNYNSRWKTWHCTCCKKRAPPAAGGVCLHKSVAKWCLFQTTGHLFSGRPLVSEPEGEIPSQEEEEVVEEIPSQEEEAEEEIPSEEEEAEEEIPSQEEEVEEQEDCGQQPGYMIESLWNAIEAKTLM